MANEKNFLKTYLMNGGSSDMAVNGASTPVEFTYTVPENQRLALSRFMFFMETPTAMSSDQFGHLTALTNGLDIKINNTVILNYKDNIDLATCMFDLPGMPNLGKETRTIVGRWTLAKETGLPIRIGAGGTVKAIVNDNLSALSHFRITIGGLLHSWGVN